ncbi:polysaccharide pyruvyl transferase family protein [Microbacterium sp. NPDC077644]|uniref:polysaccharide pyruvyl transferase family protein n=1 Tax=Microbacterium sp. NPDC077644 TaxID=3155055 RepID=UPI00344E383B
MTRRIAPPRNALANVLIPAAHGSLGDGALAAGVDAGAAALGRALTVWVPGGAEGWTGIRGGAQSIDPLRLGNTTFLKGGAHRVFGSGPVAVIGADTIGGDYLHGYLGYRVAALRQATSNGMPAMMVNFSLSSSPTTEAVRLLRRIPGEAQMYARDSLSRERARTLLDREVEMAPDIGALARPVASSESTSLVKRLGTGEYLVLSPNAHMHTKGWLTEQENHDTWFGLIGRIERDRPIVVMPHDLRARPGDVAMSGTLVEVARRAHPERQIELFVPTSVGEAKHVLASSWALVSGRMHACVGALSSGVPAVGIEYLGKFSGQFEWYGDLGEVVSYDEALDASELSHRLELAADRRPTQPQPGIQVGEFPWLRTLVGLDEAREHAAVNP